MERFDVAIIGAGIVGLAVAYRLTKRFPGRSVVVLERDAAIAQRQTGSSSGVIHSGLFSTPGSMKAALCGRGRRALLEFCEAHRIPHRISGKLIIAATPREAEALDPLHRRGMANGVDCRMVESEEIAAIEPLARGLGGIHVRDTGVVDFRHVAQRLADRAAARGARIIAGAPVSAIRTEDNGLVIETDKGEFLAGGVIACAGMHADTIARMCGADPGVSIAPFRGDFFRLRIEAEQRVRSMIYPVPTPGFPFLGPHLTRKADGSVEAGPNALLTWSRAGHGVGIGEALARLTTPGLPALSARVALRSSGASWRARGRRGYARALRRLVPTLSAADLTDHRFGVRAHAVARDGSLIDDFLMIDHARSVHIMSAPSPAATASLALADAAIDRAVRVLDWS